MESTPRCPNCVRLEAVIAGLEQRLLVLELRNRKLEEQIARLSRDSSTSSKPPSSDIIKPPRPDTLKDPGARRKIGAQSGHPQHQRQPFGEDQIADTHDYTLNACPDCAGELTLLAGRDPRVIDQVEIVPVPIRIDRHRGLPYRCNRCGKVHYAPLPEPVQTGGLFGPGLTALVAFLKGVCHASYSTIRKFLRDVLGMPVSRGFLRKVCHKAAHALDGPYRQLLEKLPSEERLNVDETGHKENGALLWTWCFRAQVYTLFKIDPSRGSQVLFEVLGKEFDGVLGCDYFSAYRKYMKDLDILVQFCLAHLIRDVRYLTTLPDEPTRTYGERLLEAIRELFKVIHQKELLGLEDGFAQRLSLAREHVLQAALGELPGTRPARNMAKRFRLHGEAYFRFLTTPGVQPTNNLAEQAIRFVVIDRYVTQGTRSETGRFDCERIWTAVATCAQQGRSVFHYLLSVIQAYFSGHPAPSLLPMPP